MNAHGCFRQNNLRILKEKNLEIGTGSIDWVQNEYVPPEEGDRLQYPKCYVLNKPG
jgi:hypothetical protein